MRSGSGNWWTIWFSPSSESASTPWRGSRPGGSSSGGRLPTNSAPVSSRCAKKGKLPWETIGQDYELEYGTDRVEIHRDAVAEGETVLVVDDLIATGGTALATLDLLRRAGAEIVGCSFVVDLPDLGGRKRLEKKGVPVLTLVEFEGE